MISYKEMFKNWLYIYIGRVTGIKKMCNYNIGNESKNII